MSIRKPLQQFFKSKCIQMKKKHSICLPVAFRFYICNVWFLHSGNRENKSTETCIVYIDLYGARCRLDLWHQSADVFDFITVIVEAHFKVINKDPIPAIPRSPKTEELSLVSFYLLILWCIVSKPIFRHSNNNVFTFTSAMFDVFSSANERTVGPHVRVRYLAHFLSALACA